ncbi:PAS domain-containing protein [Pseudolabrys sp. FHR47]|uniref:PAS domain-containing protein n=1 Tax=Pseudolabrys sp. FHR47 TaxID=2562284 RepID=UPI0010BE7121|nr:PAS domain-containing protein [Pseudolabrys sp. FHR47]
MSTFICEQNIANFQKLLATSADETLQHTLQILLAASKRELAILKSQTDGANARRPGSRPAPGDAQTVKQEIQAEFDSSRNPYMLLDPGPGLNILDVNDAYARATLIRRSEVVGKSLFEIFPDNPEHTLADGVSNLYASLKTVAQTGQPHAMAVQRYDIRNPAGEFVERHWQPINSPIKDKAGNLVFLLHHVEDVTDPVTRLRW